MIETINQHQVRIVCFSQVDCISQGLLRLSRQIDWANDALEKYATVTGQADALLRNLKSLNVLSNDRAVSND